MKYLCLAYGDQAKVESLTKEEFEALVAECRVHDEELRRTGQVLMTESLEWAVTTIRPRDGQPFVTDGPFVETKEKVGGLFLIEARDLNDAIRVASLHPAAHLGERLGWAIEVRPLADGCHQ
ncbi:MAG: YciI family protein [Planctomycetota bacterium]